MYGARPRGSYWGLSSVYRDFIGGGTFAKYDLVMPQGTTVGTGGEIVVATAGAFNILGVAMETGANAVAGTKVDITPGLLVLMDNDNDTNTFDAGYVGQVADFIGGTGAIQVDTSSHVTGVSGVANLFCVAYNPQGMGMNADTSIGLYVVKERAI